MPEPYIYRRSAQSVEYTAAGNYLPQGEHND